MPTIANLRVALIADTSGFRKGIGAVNESVKRLSIAAAGAATGLAAIVGRGLSNADELQKLSLRTGASVEALSALKLSAELSDVTLEQLGDGLINLNVSLGEAAKGTGSQADAFAALGLNVSELVALKPEQRLGVIADALNGLDDDTRAAALGNAILQDAYKTLLPQLKSGSKGMQEAADVAQRLGLIVGTDQANAAAAANDEIAKLTKTFDALTTQLSAQFAPAITDTLSGLVEVLPGVIAAVRSAFSGVGTAIGGIAFAAGQVLSGDFSGAATTVSRIGDDVDQAVQDELDKVSTNTGDSVQILREISTNTKAGAVAG